MQQLNGLKIIKKCAFVELCLTGFKIGLNARPPTLVQGCDTGAVVRHVTIAIIGNNGGTSSVLLLNRVPQKYNLMSLQRAFVHWFVGEGMEEGEFAKVRDDLGFLEKDYLDILAEQPNYDVAYYFVICHLVAMFVVILI